MPTKCNGDDMVTAVVANLPAGLTGVVARSTAAFALDVNFDSRPMMLHTSPCVFIYISSVLKSLDLIYSKFELTTDGGSSDRLAGAA